MSDHTKFAIPIELLDYSFTGLSSNVKLTLLLSAYPHLVNRPSRDVAKAMGVPEAKYNDWMTNTYKKVVRSFNPNKRVDLGEEQRRALQDVAGGTWANPSYVEAYKAKKFGTYIPIICVPEAPYLAKIRLWYPDVFDLTIESTMDLWKNKLPRYVSKNGWAKEEADMDIRVSAYVTLALLGVKNPTLRDRDAAGFLLTGINNIEPNAKVMTACRSVKGRAVPSVDDLIDEHMEEAA